MNTEEDEAHIKKLIADMRSQFKGMEWSSAYKHLRFIQEQAREHEREFMMWLSCPSMPSAEMLLMGTIEQIKQSCDANLERCKKECEIRMEQARKVRDMRLVTEAVFKQMDERKEFRQWQPLLSLAKA